MSCWKAVKQLEKRMGNKIHDFNFKPGSLVLIRNTKFDKTLSDKTKPRYFGPMVVIKRTTGGSYVLGELDGTISKLRFAAFRLLPYQPQNIKAVPVTAIPEEPEVSWENTTHDAENHQDSENEGEN